MIAAMKCLTREQEADRIIFICGQDHPGKMMDLMQQQFNVLSARSQVLLTLCGIVVTTTGFSGRLIAGTNRLAQGLVIAGVVLAMSAAVSVVGGVMHLNWLTQQPADLIRPWLLNCLEYRDQKTRAYRVGIVLLMIGLAMYVAAMSIMLLNPEAHAVTSAR
jgi:hypothetical protein